MSDRQLVTRGTLRRALLANAATKPVALATLAAVAVAALVFGAAWLLAVAAVLYLALVAATFFDGNEAERVGRKVYARARGLPRSDRALPTGLAPELETLLQRARTEEQRIRVTADAHFPEVSDEVAALTGEMERIAMRAQLIWNYLAEQRPYDVQQRLSSLRREQGGNDEAVRARARAAAALEDQLSVRDSLQAELTRVRAEMEHLIASLGVVHGQLVRMSVADDTAAAEDVTDQVRDLRRRVSAVAEDVQGAVTRLVRN